MRTSFGLRRRSSKAYNDYQHKVDVDMLNAVECVGRESSTQHSAGGS